jgi:hypothetical protein
MKFSTHGTEQEQDEGRSRTFLKHVIHSDALAAMPPKVPWGICGSRNNF